MQPVRELARERHDICTERERERERERENTHTHTHMYVCKLARREIDK